MILPLHFITGIKSAEVVLTALKEADPKIAEIELPSKLIWHLIMEIWPYHNHEPPIKYFPHKNNESLGQFVILGIQIIDHSLTQTHRT